MHASEVQELFPEMRHIDRAPNLLTINGIGTSLYGERDHEPLTRTYVKTQFFCFLFIPLFALASYRVADAEEGWFFLGKVPLSPRVRNYNLFLLGATLGLLGSLPFLT